MHGQTDSHDSTLSSGVSSHYRQQQGNATPLPSVANIIPIIVVVIIIIIISRSIIIIIISSSSSNIMFISIIIIIIIIIIFITTVIVIAIIPTVITYSSSSTSSSSLSVQSLPLASPSPSSFFIETLHPLVTMATIADTMIVMFGISNCSCTFPIRGMATAGSLACTLLTAGYPNAHHLLQTLGQEVDRHQGFRKCWQTPEAKAD